MISAGQVILLTTTNRLYAIINYFQTKSKSEQISVCASQKSCVSECNRHTRPIHLGIRFSTAVGVVIWHHEVPCSACVGCFTVSCAPEQAYDWKLAISVSFIDPSVRTCEHCSMTQTIPDSDIQSTWHAGSAKTGASRSSMQY